MVDCCDFGKRATKPYSRYDADLETTCLPPPCYLQLQTLLWWAKFLISWLECRVCVAQCLITLRFKLWAPICMSWGHQQYYGVAASTSTFFCTQYCLYMSRCCFAFTNHFMQSVEISSHVLVFNKFPETISLGSGHGMEVSKFIMCARYYLKRLHIFSYKTLVQYELQWSFEAPTLALLRLFEAYTDAVLRF